MPWYEEENSKGTFYTPFVEKKSVPTVIGDGINYPTAQQVVDALNSSPNSSMSDRGDFMYVQTRDRKSKAVELPSGIFKHIESNYPDVEMLRPFTLRTDNYIELPSQQDHIRKEIETFLGSEQLHRDVGLLYKRGMLLFGPPGEGKTSLIRNLLGKTVPQNSLIIFLDEVPSAKFLSELAAGTQGRLKVFIFEEFVNIATDQRESRKVLDFLDGETSIDSSLIIATTNYPHLIPGNIVDRPSRFDKLIEVTHPDEDARKRLLTHFLKREPTDAELEQTVNMSTAAIKEASYQSVIKPGSTLLDAIEAIKEQSRLVEKSFSTSKIRMGFD